MLVNAMTMPMTLKNLNMFVATDLHAGLLPMFARDPAGRLMRALDALTAEGVSP
jgi:hypothetical protein